MSAGSKQQRHSIATACNFDLRKASCKIIAGRILHVVSCFMSNPSTLP